MKKSTIYGTLLKAAMKRAGTSIDKLAAASSVSGTAIVYYRNGYRDPTRDKMVAIARALNEPITAFFSDDEFSDKTPLEREESTVTALIAEGHTNLKAMAKNSTMTESRIDLTLQRLRKRGAIRYFNTHGKQSGEWHMMGK